MHHWGAGGGGSHYHTAGSKQFLKGVRIRGVVSRHSKQGAKMQAARVQAARNKQNRGTPPSPCSGRAPGRGESAGGRAEESTRVLLKRVVLLAGVLHVVELLLDLDLSLERGLGVASADPG